MTSDDLDDGAWFKANPDRSHRIRWTGVPDSRGLVKATIVRMGDPERRVWSRQNIRMRAELPNDDAGAKQALADYEVMQNAQIARLNGGIAALPGATVIDAVLAKLRGTQSA